MHALHTYVSAYIHDFCISRISIFPEIQKFWKYGSLELRKFRNPELLKVWNSRNNVHL